MIYGNFNPLPSRSVANIIQRGGTILETSRPPLFKSEAGRTRALGAFSIATAVKERVGIEARIVVLGHIQRGGVPTARDRLLASRLGTAAVTAITEGRAASLVGEEHGEVVLVPLREAAGKHRQLDPGLIDLVAKLSL